MSEPAWLVVGLGNPGPGYAGNRHNVGFMVLDVLAERVRGRFKAHKGRAELVETHIGDARVVLAKPRSYMNESGGPVAGLRDFFRATPDHLLVVHDELDLPYAVLRLKFGGGDNGHNGLKSIRRSLGTGDSYRVRFGVGRPPGRQDPADYVLRDFSAGERKELPFHLDRAADAVECVLTDGLQHAQNVYN